MGLAFPLEITAFPGLNEFTPSGGIKDVHRRHLSLVHRPVGDLVELHARSFSAIGGGGLHPGPSFGFAHIFSSDLVVVVRHGIIHEIPKKLFRCRARLDDGGWQVHGIGYHQLYDAVLIAHQVEGDFHGFTLVGDVGEFYFIAFQYNDRKDTLIISECTSVLPLDQNAHRRYSHQTISGHYNSIQLHDRVSGRLELSLNRGDPQRKPQAQQV